MVIKTVDSPSNASLILDKLNEESKINLYPEDKKSDVDSMLESYNERLAIQEEVNNRKKEHMQFMDDLKEYIFESYLFTSVIEPVLQEQMVSTRQYELAAKLTEDFAKENGIDNLLDRFKYQNVYLAEVAYNTNKLYSALQEGINCKIKEGLSEKEATKIEEKTINNYILDTTSKIPTNVTNTIMHRVEDSINDFIDEKKKAQFQLAKVYTKAQEKVDKYNQAKDAVDFINQLDDPNASMDGEANYNARMNMQQSQNDMDSAMTPQQEAVADAKAAEYEILSKSTYSIFDGMMRSFVESVHSVDALNEAYTNEDKSINFNKVFSDVKTMYTFLECVNTLEMTEVNEKYLQDMLKSLAGK